MGRRRQADLTFDAWGAVARAALTAEGDSLSAWVQLSLVSRAWRDGLKGGSQPSLTAPCSLSQLSVDREACSLYCIALYRCHMLVLSLVSPGVQSQKRPVAPASRHNFAC